MNDLDETVVAVRAHGPTRLPLDGWDHASIWGWDETIGSLYAHLWRNCDDPSKPPAIRIRPDDFMPTITLAATLAQHIAMAADCDPWDILTALYQVDDQGVSHDDDGPPKAAPLRPCRRASASGPPVPAQRERDQRKRSRRAGQEAKI